MLYEDIGISLTAYGSLNLQAIHSYEKIKSAYNQAFPEAGIQLAFTSEFVRRKLSEKQGIFFHSPVTSLKELRDEGYKKIVIQSLHIAPGSEFHGLARMIHELKDCREESGFQALEIGMPLLANLEDCMRVSKALLPEFQRIQVEGNVKRQVEEQNHAGSTDPEEVAFVLMGHGTNHPADSVYSMMAKVLERDHKNVFMGTLEGFPGIDDVILQTNRSEAKRVRLMPFLLVVGGHAQEDLAGDSANSWKSAFERVGFQTEVSLKGLGDIEDIVDIFVEHTRKAVEKLMATDMNPKDQK